MNIQTHINKLEEILASKNLPEISINFKVRPTLKKAVETPKDRADFIRGLFDDNSFDLQERFVVVILDHDYNPFGYFTHAIGTMDMVVSDSKLLFQKLLLVGGTRFIVAHNHPVSIALPSNEDTAMTWSLKHKAAFLDLTLVDHIILSREGYYSFEEQGFL